MYVDRLQHLNKDLVWYQKITTNIKSYEKGPSKIGFKRSTITKKHTHEL